MGSPWPPVPATPRAAAPRRQACSLRSLPDRARVNVESTSRRTHVELALSGAGARGVSRLGALRLLERLRVPVVCIVGARLQLIRILMERNAAGPKAALRPRRRAHHARSGRHPRRGLQRRSGGHAGRRAPRWPRRRGTQPRPCGQTATQHVRPRGSRAGPGCRWSRACRRRRNASPPHPSAHCPKARGAAAVIPRYRLPGAPDAHRPHPVDRRPAQALEPVDMPARFAGPVESRGQGDFTVRAALRRAVLARWAGATTSALRATAKPPGRSDSARCASSRPPPATDATRPKPNSRAAAASSTCRATRRSRAATASGSTWRRRPRAGSCRGRGPSAAACSLASRSRWPTCTSRWAGPVRPSLRMARRRTSTQPRHSDQLARGYRRAAGRQRRSVPASRPGLNPTGPCACDPRPKRAAARCGFPAAR